MRVPPLRERDDDVVGLASHFLADLNRRAGTDKRFSRRAIDIIETHRWPGNVRELRNAVQRGFILAEDSVDLPDPTSRPLPRTALRSGCLDISVGTPLADAQRQIIVATLAHFNGNKPETAAALGVSLKTLYNRLQIYFPGGTDGTDAEGSPAT